MAKAGRSWGYLVLRGNKNESEDHEVVGMLGRFLDLHAVMVVAGDENHDDDDVDGRYSCAGELEQLLAAAGVHYEGFEDVSAK